MDYVAETFTHGLQCPLEGCIYGLGSNVKPYALCRHFGYRHLPDNICIPTEGSCPRCDRCDMQVAVFSEKQWRRHHDTDTCQKGHKRKQQREAYRRNALSLGKKFTAYGQELERVEFFKYLGRILTYDDKDIQDVCSNLNKARAVWKRILHEL